MMSFENVMRTLAVVVCLYAVAYFITSMSVAALNAVTHTAGPTCGQSGCVTLAHERSIQVPQYDPVSEKDPIWMAASFLQFD